MPEHNHAQFARILAIDPYGGGFAYVVLEGRGRLIDWGLARLSSKSEQEFLVRLDQFITRYRPLLLVCEGLPNFRRKRLAGKYLKVLFRYAREERILVETATRGDVREAFAEVGKTKGKVAETISREYLELAAYLPEPRKLWKSEDSRMHIFDAFSFILALPEARRRRGR